MIGIQVLNVLIAKFVCPMKTRAICLTTGVAFFHHDVHAQAAAFL